MSVLGCLVLAIMRTLEAWLRKAKYGLRIRTTGNKDTVNSVMCIKYDDLRMVILKTVFWRYGSRAERG